MSVSTEPINHCAYQSEPEHETLAQKYAGFYRRKAAECRVWQEYAERQGNTLSATFYADRALVYESEANQTARTRALVSGFDYKHQAWVVDGMYVSCGHSSLIADATASCTRASTPRQTPIFTDGGLPVHGVIGRHAE